MTWAMMIQPQHAKEHVGDIEEGDKHGGTLSRPRRAAAIVR